MAPLNGVSTVSFKGSVFYAVCFQGALQPTIFKSWLEAREHLVALLQQEIEEQPT